MSVAGILGSNGKIQSIYLPSGTTSPNLSQVLTEGNTSGANDMVLAQSLLMPTSGAPLIELDGTIGVIDCTTLRVNNGPTNTIQLSSNGEIACTSLEAEGGTIIVKRNGSAGVGLVCAPLNETTGTSAFTLRNGTTSINPVNYVFYNPSSSGSGFTAGSMQIRAEGPGYTNTVLEVNANGDIFVVGDSSIIGGAALEINGSLGTGRVYDATYNRTFTITPIASGTGNIVTNTALTGVAAGTYQLQLTAETIVAPLAPNINLSVFANEPPSTNVINYSCAGISSTGYNSQVIGLNSGFFTFAGGNLTIRVESSGANWTASEWSVQLVRFG